MVGIFGAYVTIKATLATLEDAAEERRVGDQIVSATDGYVAGFMAGVGWKMGGGDAAWFADGQTKGAAAKDALVAKVKADPVLSKYDIGPDEVLLHIADSKLRGVPLRALRRRQAADCLAVSEEVAREPELGDEDLHQRGGGRRAADPHPCRYAGHRPAARTQARRVVTTRGPR